MTQGLEAPSRFSVGGVVGASLALLRRNFWQFFAVAVVAGLPLLALSFLFAMFGAPVPRGPGAGPPFAAPAPLQTLFSLGLGFLAILTYFVIQAAINFGALQELRGARPAVGACIARGIAVLPRVFVAALLLFLAMFALSFVALAVFYGLGMAAGAASTQGSGLGIVSLVAVIGVFALAMWVFVSWWVFVPAIVTENAGPMACFGRSRRLTKGHRWGILGIVLLVFVTNLASSLVIGMIGQAGAVATAALLNVVVALAFSALSSVLTAVGYYALRAEKEGFGLADLARVFD
jgi:hypothetical protein